MVAQPALASTDRTRHATGLGRLPARTRICPAAACALFIAGIALGSGTDQTKPERQPAKPDSNARAERDVAPAERSPEAERLARRGLTRSGKFYVVAAEQEFADEWNKVRSRIDALQAASNQWHAALQAEAQFRELDAIRSEVAAQIKDIQNRMNRTPDRLVRRWHQANLNAAQANLNGVKAQLAEAKQWRVGPAKLKSLGEDVQNRKDEFTAAAAELDVAYKKLRTEYDAMRKDGEIRAALDVLREKKKLNVSLGPSDSVLNAIRRVELVRKQMSPDANPGQVPKKRLRLKSTGKIKGQGGSPRPKGNPGP